MQSNCMYLYSETIEPSRWPSSSASFTAPFEISFHFIRHYPASASLKMVIRVLQFIFVKWRVSVNDLRLPARFAVGLRLQRGQAK